MLFTNKKSGLKESRIIAVVFLMSFLFCLPFKSSFAIEEVKFYSELRTGLSSPVDVATASDGNVYVLDERLSKVNVYDSYGKFLFEFGSKGAAPGAFNRPASIAIGPGDHVVVADTGNSRIQVFAPDGKFLFSFGNSGVGSGQFKKPQAVAVSHGGLIYVVDSVNQKFQRFSPGGVYLGQMSLEDKPLDIALGPQGHFFVLFPASKAIVEYTPGGKKLKTYHAKVHGKDYLAQAAGLAVDGRGDIYITEHKDHSLKKFDRQNRLLLSFGSEGSSKGQLHDPAGLTVDDKGMIYLADNRNKRVQLFQVEGIDRPVVTLPEEAPDYVDAAEVIQADTGIVDLAYSKTNARLYALSDKKANILVHDTMNKIIGGPGKGLGEFRVPVALHATKAGPVYVADTGNNRVEVFSGDGAPEFVFGEGGYKNGRFKNPSGIAVDSYGKIFIADTQNNRIQIFNEQGIFLQAFGSRTGKNTEQPPQGTFLFPAALDMDTDDNLYVADTGNNRIQVFKGRGDFLRVVGRAGSGPGEFEDPVDVAVNAEGYLFVADKGNNRIQIFDKDGRFLLAFGCVGSGPLQLQDLSAVAVSDKKIYVADYRSDQIRVFDFYPRRKVERKAEAPQAVMPKVAEEVEEEFELK